MKKQFDFDSLVLSDYTEEIFLYDKTAESLNELVNELGISDKIKFHKTEKEDEENTIIFNGEPSEEKFTMNLNYDAIRENFILGDLNYSKTIELITLDQLVEIDDSINFFELPSDEEFLELLKSIKKFGIIEPLLVVWDETLGKYIVVLGRSRLLAARALHEKSQDDKYFKVPCILIDGPINYSMIQGIIISSNMNYRKMSRETFMKSIFLLDEIYKTTDIYRSENSIVGKIAKITGVSRTTVNNYLEFKNLSPLAMDLVVNKHMNLSVARALAKTDHGTQNMIITGLKNNINDLRKVYAMMEGPLEKIYDKESNSMIKETWEMKVNRTNNMVPHYTYVTIRVTAQDIENTFNNINAMRRECAFKYLPEKKNSINKYFKVTYKENDIKQYIRRGFGRVGERLATFTPHRSVQAQLTHTALHS